MPSREGIFIARLAHGLCLIQNVPRSAEAKRVMVTCVKTSAAMFHSMLTLYEIFPVVTAGIAGAKRSRWIFSSVPWWPR